jgi:hypothetical protein
VARYRKHADVATLECPARDSCRSAGAAASSTALEPWPSQRACRPSITSPTKHSDDDILPRRAPSPYPARRQQERHAVNASNGNGRVRHIVSGASATAARTAYLAWVAPFQSDCGSVGRVAPDWVAMAPSRCLLPPAQAPQALHRPHPRGDGRPPGGVGPHVSRTSTSPF